MPNKTKVGLIHLGKKQASSEYLAQQLDVLGYQTVDYDAEKFTVTDTSVNEFIINLDDSDFDLESLIHELERHGAKIIFNDTKVANDLVGWNKNRWLRHLLHKLNPRHDLFPKVVDMKMRQEINLKQFGIHQVWILAASIGEPEAILRFLGEFSGDEPLLFIIVQHMDSEFVGMMEKQLQKNPKITVKIAASGVIIKAGEALLVPVDEDIMIQSDGSITVKDYNPLRAATPCIDDVCADLISQLKKVNMAVFSGMAKDGVVGATNVFENGGTIITQTAASSVVSSISDEVRRLNMSQFDGKPEEMAHYITEKLELKIGD